MALLARWLAPGLVFWMACGGEAPPSGPGADATPQIAMDAGHPDAEVEVLDGDQDGLPDAWERDNGLDPTRDDAAEDLDEDGLDNAAEFRGGTRANDIDSDDDGLADGEEDLNHDGVVDPGETSATNSDTDGDGIGDGTERGRTEPLTSARPGISATEGSFVPDLNTGTRTDPLNPDTDGDGVSDGAEDLNRNGALDAGELNPLDADTDDDGLADGAEDTNFNGRLDAGETSATEFDTDGDGLGDGLERGVSTPVADPDGQGPLLGTDPGRWRPDLDPTTTTDPSNADTDGDGVRDGDEDWNRNGRFDPPRELDPNSRDSNADGIPDGEEGIAVVCAESGLRPVMLRSLASADLTLGLAPSYSEISVLRDSNQRGVGFMFHDPMTGVVGFAVSKTPRGSDVQDEKQRNRNRLNQVAALSNEQDRALITWDGFPAVFTSATASGGNRTPIALVAEMATEIVQGGALSGGLPNGGASSGSFTVYFETILRTPQRAIVVGALVPGTASDPQIIALSDVANGTGVAQFGDFTGTGCDPFVTPDGNDVLDLLWVVDNSCSMSDEQQAVTAAGNEMVNLLTTTQLSWRLALTTTDRANGSITNSGVNGFTASSPRATAEAESRAWATAVAALGTGGSGQERGLVVGLAAVRAALPATSNEARDKLRAGATVIVVHMSDEEDYSVKEAGGGTDGNCPENAGKQARIDQLTSEYVALGAEPSIAGLTTFAIHGIQPGNAANYCAFGGGAGDCAQSQHGRSYVDVAAATGGGGGSICGNMGQVVQDIIRAGAGIASQIELTEAPISATIRVVMANEAGSFAGQPDVPRSRTDGFDYAFELDVQNNVVRHKIVFYGNARPPARRALMISYRTWENGSPQPGGPVCECPDGQLCNPDTNDCEVDPTCGGGCPEDEVCDPMTGLCGPEEPCQGMCVEGEICLDGVCVEEDPCMCPEGQICDRSVDPPVCVGL